MTKASTKPTIMITGANGCIGRAYARAAANSVNLILIDVNESGLSKLYSELSSSGSCEHRAMTCDLSNHDARKNLIELLNTEYTELNGLINNAAFTGDSKLDGWIAPFEKQSLDSWRVAVEVNLTAAFHLSQGLSQLLTESHDAHILNIGSIYGDLGPDMRIYDGTTMGNPAAYAASKGGLVQLTKWLATTMAPNVRVNCVSPGGILRKQPRKFVKAYEARTPLGRMAKEEDIVGAMLFLTVGQSQYITGHNLVVDGGFSIW